jgi:hypothetical protein
MMSGAHASTSPATTPTKPAIGSSSQSVALADTFDSKTNSLPLGVPLPPGTRPRAQQPDASKSMPLAPEGQSGWAIVDSPNVPGHTSTSLAGVTCLSASDCWAVGYSLVDSTYQTSIARWDGTSWVFVTSPNTSPKQSNVLIAVTCVSASDCWAVGYHSVPGGTQQTLIEGWDGTSWTIVSSPDSSPSQHNFLLGATCVSASDCWAVGHHSVAGGIWQTLIERWDGTSWAVVPSANTNSTRNNYLDDVTCVSASDCWAVGRHHNGIVHQTLIERWDGTSWAIVTSPSTLPIQDNFLTRVTCVSASECWAVGRSFNRIALQTLIERWDGTSWAIVPSPNTSATRNNALTGVTCLSASDCWAVGFHSLPGNLQQTLIERWDGTAWVIVTSPNTSAEQHNVLDGVTCVSASDCWAVGQASPGGTLVLRYTAVPTTDPSPTPSASPQPEASEVSFTDDSRTLGQFSDETFFEALLTDPDGDAIGGANLVFTLTGAGSSRSFTAITTGEGVASVTPMLEEKPGPHQLTVRFTGDTEHAGDADTTTFVVDREDSDTELTVSGQGKNRTLTARLFDRDTTTDGVADRTIDFSADGELIGSATTDGSGVATLKPPPRYRSGKHDFEARFDGDDYYRSSSASSQPR